MPVYTQAKMQSTEREYCGETSAVRNVGGPVAVGTARGGHVHVTVRQYLTLSARHMNDGSRYHVGRVDHARERHRQARDSCTPPAKPR